MVDGAIVELAGDELHHAVRVNRVRDGENIELLDGKGRAALAVVRSVARDRLVVEVLSTIEDRESMFAIDLAVALIHPDRFELVLQKGTELGVRRFLPIVTARSEIRPERIAGKATRWQKILLEATKQCGRARIPTLVEPRTFLEILEREEAAKVMFDADTEDRSGPITGDGAILLVGPEGGWTPEELEIAGRNGCFFRRLGPRRLRAETAAIAAAVAIGLECGDLARA